MTPKEKAEELVWYFGKSIGANMSYQQAKDCATKSVDEVIKYAQRWGDMAVDDIKEFEELKKEIENL